MELNMFINNRILGSRLILFLFFITSVFLFARPAHAQPYANSWTEITDGGDTINHVWPPPDSLWLHDQLIIKFRRGALDYSQLCYNIDSIDAGSGLTPDSLMYWPTCKD